MRDDIFTVLIPDGEEILALHVARCLSHTRKVKVHILSDKPLAWGRFSRFRQLYQYKAVGDDYEKRFDATVELIERHNIDILLPVSDLGVDFAATKYKTLSNLVTISPIPDPQSLRTAKDKWLLNQFAQELGLPVPPACLVTFSPDFYRQLSMLEYPVFLKPTMASGGGLGIKPFKTLADLQEFLENQDKEALKDRHIIQSYAPGSDVSLNVLCRNGEILAFNIQHSVLGSTGDYGPPTAIQYIKQDDVFKIGRKLLSALNWNGVANIDLLYNEQDGQIKLLEVNPRFWGSTPGPLGVGINFPYLTCLTALDTQFPMPPYKFGKYLHTGTAAKQFILRPFGKHSVNGFSFEETGLRFFLLDPIPETIHFAAKWARGRNQRFIPSKIRNLLEQVP